MGIPEKLEVIYIVPSRYDDDGYVVRWWRGVVPSNSVSCLKALTEAAAPEGRFSLAENAIEPPWDGEAESIELSVRVYDDTVQQIPIERIARRHRRPGTRVVVGLVGVQSNQFERASDLALQLRQRGVPVMIGGFHVSGMLALFDAPSPELQRLLDAGVSLIWGEAETPAVFRKMLRDAVRGTMEPIYKFPAGPDIADAAVPVADPEYIDRFGVRWATVDTSRGCPFGCTFCTVINVQGRKMRCRSSEAVLEAIRKNHAHGVANYFFTDDNFARNRNWRPILEGLRKMREEEGLEITFMMQVDTQAYQIAGFVEAAQRAGCRMVFVGMESVNPANLEAAGKAQNDVKKYRDMVLCWQRAEILVHVGYIIGFEHDTEESVQRDITFLRDHVGVDEASFFMLTPLPGSADHREMVLNSSTLDPDLNKYDSFHETYVHSKMPKGTWKRVSEQAYADFYTKDNCVRILRRVPAKHYWYMFWNCVWYRYSGVYSGVHPMSTGVARRKERLERRRSLPRESLLRFAWRRMRDGIREAKIVATLFWEFQEVWLLTRRGADPRFAPLVDLRAKWDAMQQYLAKCDWSGRVDEAWCEVRRLLATMAQRLRQVSESSCAIGRRQARRLQSLAGDIERFLAGTEGETPDRKTLAKARRFITCDVVARCEELAFRYVRTRRRFNRWWRETMESLRRGRIFSPALLRGPYMAVCELFLGVPFAVAAVRKSDKDIAVSRDPELASQ